MPAVANARMPKNTIRSRLAALRRRIRFITAVRGLGLFVYALLTVAVVAGALDWYHPLPALVRALFLVGGLGAAGYVLYVYLLRPFSARTDDLTLALQVESRFPNLNDSLASAVQFLDEDADRFGSPALRREALRATLKKVRKLDFSKAIDARGLLPAGLAGAGAVAVVVLLFWLVPAQATTALFRLADPFGERQWPSKTVVEVLTRTTRIARGQPYAIEARIRGFLPQQATLRLTYEKGFPEDEVHELDHEPGADTMTFHHELSAEQTKRGNFSFQVVANDGASKWIAVTVVPPPFLVPLDGRASPQVRLDYPAYSDLSPRELPEGNGDVVDPLAVAGTRATFRAAADRPLSRAWLEFQPDLDQTDLLAFLAALGGSVPAELDASRGVLEVRFEPRFHGTYVLHIEDDDHVSNAFYYAVHVDPDPSPAVELTRPEPGHMGLMLLPDAEFTLGTLVHDKVFAVRSAALEYQVGQGGGSEQVPLYDARWTPSLLALAPTPAAPLPASWRARLPQVALDQRLRIKEFHRPGADVPGLQPGDVLFLQVTADDFDDVTLRKPPGHSHRLEIHIVDRNALEVALGKEQARVQQELVRQHEKQRQAIEEVNKAKKALEVKGKLDDEAQQHLEKAEQQQREVREAIGNQEKGLRAEVARLQEAMKDNHLPHSAMKERIDDVGAELDRLAQSELNQVEPLLNDARKSPDPTDQSQREETEKKLNEAGKHQQEIQRSLDALLTRLEPISSALEYKGEARAILQEQRELLRRTRELEAKTQGKNPDELKAEEKLELERLKDAQNQLLERMNRLEEKMERLVREKQQADPQTASEMREALELARKANLSGQMRDSRTDMENNQLGAASSKQQQATQDLEKLVKALEDRREQELDRLSKRLKEQEDEVAKLAREQEELQKKMQQIAQDPQLTPAQREEALKRLGRQQRDLQKRAEEVREQLRQLSRLRAERASQAIAQATERMEQNAQQLERGQAPNEQQEEALDRLNEAKQELAKARADAEEELAREQLAKVADEIRNFKARHETLMAEARRIQADNEKDKGWSRGRRVSLGELAENQKLLADEVNSAAKNRLEQAVVFARVLARSGEAMEEAGNQFKEQLDRLQDEEAAKETTLSPRGLQSQQEALQLLDQLLDVLKREPGIPRRAGGQGGGGDRGGGGGGRQGDNDAIPDILQLKLLRSLQADVKQRAEEFGKLHPDLTKLTDDEKAQLEGLHKRQADIVDLLEQLTTPPGEGGMP